MITAQRTIEQFDVQWEAAADAEILEAKGGRVLTVSNRAAARYLGVHYITLGKWRNRTPPKGPLFIKGEAEDGSMAANQHVHYKFQDIEVWLDARKGTSYKERKGLQELEDLGRMRRELELQLEIQSAKDEIARLRKRIGAKGLAFATLADCAELHDWTVHDGAITGHVLTVSDAELARALVGDGIVSLTIEEALGEAWTDAEQRNAFGEAMEVAITGARQRAGKGLEASVEDKNSREREAIEKALGPPPPARPIKVL